MTNRDATGDLVSRRVARWVDELEHFGYWSQTMVDSDCGFKTPSAKDARRQAINRLKKSGMIQPHPKNPSQYRKFNKTLEKLDWLSVDPDVTFDIKWPFKFLNERVITTPGSLILVAGAKSAGKTSFLLNVAKLNMVRHHVRYLSSEFNEYTLARRIRNFTDITPEEWTFDPARRSSEFEDAIEPDALNIIDFLELHDDFFLVGKFLRHIFDALNDGIAIVALQKNPGADLPLGGNRALDNANLIILLDKGKVTIKDAKYWQDDQENPVGKSWTYQLVRGAKYVNVMPEENGK